MARNTKIVTIDREGRDFGKAFLVTEMNPMQAFKWGSKAVIALVNAGVQMPDGSGDMGFAGLMGVAFSHLQNGLDWEEVEPLLDQLMTCVKYIPEPSNKAVTRSLIDSDIDEVATIALLHSEVFKIHVNFTTTEKASV